MTFRFPILFLSGLLLVGGQSFAAATQTKVDLLLDHEVAVPGQTILAGVRMKMPEGWHTYWRNPGDSGKATEIKWQLPAGITAGEIQWPVPEKFEAEGFFTYVFHNEVVLRVPLTIPAGATLGPTEIRAAVDWLECKETCLPGKGEVSARLTIANEPNLSANAQVIDDWGKRLPQPTTTPVTARWADEASEDERQLLIGVKPDAGVTITDYFPHLDPAVEIGAATEIDTAADGAITIRKTVLRFGDAVWPTSFAGVLVAKAEGATTGQEFTAQIGGTTTIAAADAPLPGQPRSSAESAPVSFWQMLLYAFLGGLILNIMPCVLPVIALKILGFVQQSKEAPGRVRMHGVVHTAGVLFSFLVLGVLAVVLSAAYGQQFQDARFLVLLCVLMTLVTLNLFGVFEITLGGRAMDAASSATAKGGYAGTFFNGLLATVLATSCSAPILGTALGFALKIGQSPGVTILFFVTIGVGMALPYLMLSLQPAWLKFLPRPGAWMERFKVLMGFPMLATAVWLYTLAGERFGESGPIWLGLFLVVVALAAWVFGQFAQKGLRRPLAIGVAGAMLLTGYVFLLEGELNWRQKPAAGMASRSGAVTTAGITWKPWSHEAIAKAQAEGRPVLVDFTAKWCVTCQLNKKTSIEIPEVVTKLRAINATTLRGDWTTEDPAITDELRAFGRAGVPMVLVYSPDGSAKPQLLPELLTPHIVLEALDRAAGE